MFSNDTLYTLPSVKQLFIQNFFIQDVAKIRKGLGSQIPSSIPHPQKAPICFKPRKISRSLDYLCTFQLTIHCSVKYYDVRKKKHSYVFKYLQSAYVESGPGIIFGSCCALATLLQLLLPETSGKELPQSVRELKEWEEQRRTTIIDDPNRKT